MMNFMSGWNSREIQNSWIKRSVSVSQSPDTSLNHITWLKRLANRIYWSKFSFNIQLSLWNKPSTYGHNKKEKWIEKLKSKIGKYFFFFRFFLNKKNIHSIQHRHNLCSHCKLFTFRRQMVRFKLLQLTHAHTKNGCFKWFRWMRMKSC